MAAKLSDLVDKMSGDNLQADGHAKVPTQSAMDLWEPEEEEFPFLLAVLVSSPEATIWPP